MTPNSSFEVSQIRQASPARHAVLLRAMLWSSTLTSAVVDPEDPFLDLTV